ncbi:hypothetical protein EW146_g6054 [Bondarzewia mesenterica]|uniref:Aldehyde dehydrogenase n=1 Tax=Bondarzewia mesenterica TaxID=1095465 RepID=A0A4S4LVD7_9AGAM|nr:hypothetical protein EW146_g6054 [Bondarzewia mesenterica]
MGYTTTPIDQIPLIRSELQKAFRSGKTRPIAYRKQQLLALAYLVKDNIKLFQEALAADLGRHFVETSVLELGSTLTDAKVAYDNVTKWSKTERASWSFNWFLMKPTLRKEPKGVVLIISPFNYPIWLSLGPLAGAIAAGNAVVLKPSEQTPAYSALLAELVEKYLDNDVVKVIIGAVPETTKVLELPWDHILYTGGGRVARIVLTAAAQTLTPVTTELGGKSPVFIDPNCDLKTAARRLMWGKVSNAGQTCVAPDYVLVQREFVPKLVEACKQVLNKFFPEGAEKSDSFSRIISISQFERITGLLKSTKGEIVYGGGSNADKKFIEPTIVIGVDGADSLMSEEIFGPILPIVPVDSLDEAIEFVNARDHPLALYVFSQDPKFKAKVFDNTQSGSAVANECMLQTVAEGLPFGGIGPSGSGAHTGKFTFDIFTHVRASLDNPSWLDMIMSGRYPPYTVGKKSQALEALTFPSLPPRNAGNRRWGKWFLFALAVALSSSGVLMFRARVRSA